MIGRPLEDQVDATYKTDLREMNDLNFARLAWVTLLAAVLATGLQ